MMNAFSNTTRAIGVALFVAALAGNVGCTKLTTWKPSKMFSLDNTWPFRDKDAPQEGMPTRVAGTWTDTVLSQPGKKPQRGFGGRLVFYEEDEKKPILVDGQLVVYAFDETGREATDNKPTRRYVFPADQVPLHMSKNELGASYSFFLPWDDAGGPKTEVSLVCRFEPKDGAVVTSEQTRHMLPGSVAPAQIAGTKQPPKLPEGVPAKPVVPTLQSMQKNRAEERRAQQASYESVAPSDPQGSDVNATTAVDAPARRMSATTINLPGSFQMPNAAAAAATQPAVHAPQQYVTNQSQLQQMPAAAVQQLPVTRPFAGAQPLVSSSGLSAPVAYGQPANVAGYGMPAPQLPINSQAMTLPPTQNMMQAPASYSTSSTAQTQPTQQQAQQQAALQLQLLQQQMMQQQALQQRMIQPQSPPQPAASQQMPTQAGATANVSYPVAGQYLR